MFVFGTRPEAIKMAPLIRKFQQYPDIIKTVVCVTAQHREMLDQVLHLFDITPDYDLNIMKKDQDLYDVTSRVLLGMRDVLRLEKPDIVLVHGDTTTSMSAAIAAFYQQIAVGHVEAGLRTHTIYSPWPEELNRQLTSRITTYHFAPTVLSRQNLLKEAIPEEKIFVVGNTVIDALHLVLEKIGNNIDMESSINTCLERKGLSLSLLEKWKRSERKLLLVTGHRRENFGEGFLNICKALKIVSEKYSWLDIVYPMHLNPNVRKPIMEVFGQDHTDNYSNLYLIEPLDYLPFVYLMNLSTLVLTDSGGIQEEAPGLGKPVLVMRETTERPEAVDAGTVKLVGTNCDNIVDNVVSLLEDKNLYSRMSKATNPYGDGDSAEKIFKILS